MLGALLGTVKISVYGYFFVIDYACLGLGTGL